jgi:hypothetical protein
MKSVTPIRASLALAVITFAAQAPGARASTYELLTGLDAGLYPGGTAFVAPTPGPGFPGTFRDGDRLAGTADITGGTADEIAFLGVGTPFYQPNQFGAASFIFRRGSVPVGGPNVLPLLGIEYLGGPLLDLDGDADNGSRSLIPVSGQTPVALAGSFSQIDFDIDVTGGTATLVDFDATGTNEGGPGIPADTATTIAVIAGTTPLNGKTDPINPAFDTRSGTVTAFAGNGGLTGVYAIESLPFEIWNDTISINSSSAFDLGTFQQFVRTHGWYVRRDAVTGDFPTLAGEGMGGTDWPTTDTSEVGATIGSGGTDFTLAFPGPGGAITDGNAADSFSAGPGGAPLAGDDLGAYFDDVIVPLIPDDSPGFVYLAGAGFGINNSFDPVFADSVGYDLVVIAFARPPAGDIDGDGDVDADDAAKLAAVLLDPVDQASDVLARADLNDDGDVDGDDVQPFMDVLLP